MILFALKIWSKKHIQLWSILINSRITLFNYNSNYPVYFQEMISCVHWNIKSGKYVFNMNCESNMGSFNNYLDHLGLVTLPMATLFLNIKVFLERRPNFSNRKYRESPTYSKITNTVSTHRFFGLWNLQVRDFCASRGPTIVPLTWISCNTIFSKSQNVHKAGTLFIGSPIWIALRSSFRGENLSDF